MANFTKKPTTVTIEIADTIVERAGLSADQIVLELAIVLFQQGSVTLGQASEMAGLHQFWFQQELAKRKIPIHYGVEEFERDLETIKQI